MKIFSIIALSLVLSTNALAGSHGNKGKHDDERYLQKLTEKLELSEDQAAAVSQLHSQYKADKKALRETYRNDLREVLSKEQLEKYLKMKEKRRQKKDAE